MKSMSVFEKTKAMYDSFRRKVQAEAEKVDAAQKSGDYSAKKIADMRTEAAQNRKREAEILRLRLGDLRTEYENQLLQKEDFVNLSDADSSALSRLSRLLNSGIKLSAKEYERYARNFENNRVAMRLLQDSARSNGLYLNGYMSIEDKMTGFDNYLKAFIRGIDSDNSLELLALEDINPATEEEKLDHPLIWCASAGDSWEAAQSRIKAEISAASGSASTQEVYNAFLAGFWRGDYEGKLEEEQRIKAEAKDQELTRFETLSEDAQKLTMLNARFKSICPDLTTAMDKAEELLEQKQNESA